MDEITLLKDLGRELGTAGEKLKPSTRQRVLAATVNDRRSALRRKPFRIAVPVGVASLVGALAVTVSIVVQSTGTAQIDSVGAGSAAVADPPPASNSFVYTRSREREWSDPWRQTRSGKVVAVPSKPSTDIRESWMSVDGTRDGGLGQDDGTPTLSFAGCSGGRENAAHGGDLCRPMPAYQADFPTTVAAARDELYRPLLGNSTSVAEGAFERIGDLMIEKLMSPASRAALFEVAISTPGAVVVPGTSTVDGVSGTLLTRRTGVNQEELLFNAQTHELMARATVPVLASGEAGSPSSKGAYSQVVLERGVVAEFALRPNGTRATAAGTGRP
jgi:hypothetical protein